MVLSKDFVEKVGRFYVNKIRPYTSVWLWKKYYSKGAEENIEEWNKIKNLPIVEFGNAINEYEYEWDAGSGLLDSSFCFNNPGYFFADLRKGRDCDDFARIWNCWAVENGHEAKEYVILDSKKPFSKAHFITILKVAGKYWLANYYPYGPYEKEKYALREMENWYDRDNLIAIEYEHKKEKC